MDDSRKSERYADFGRVECAEICAFAGRLDDIGLGGFKATFFSSVDLRMDGEYEVTLRLSNIAGEALRLLAVPVWRFDDNTGDSADIQLGFSVLPALDFPLLEDYISKMDGSGLRVSVAGEVEFADEVFEEEGPCQFL